MTKDRWMGGTPVPKVIDTEYSGCNFSQPQPVDVGGGVYENVRLFPGDDTPRTFIECNLTNAEPPPGSSVVRCNTTIIQMGISSASETVSVDGEVIALQHYVNIVHGVWSDTGYLYFPSPRPEEVAD